MLRLGSVAALGVGLLAGPAETMLKEKTGGVR